MSFQLNKIENYKIKKFVVKNISGLDLVIGDLKIKIKRNQAQDLFYQDIFTKKPLRRPEEVYNSRDLDLLINSGKVEIYSENGKIDTSTKALSYKTTGDELTQDQELKNKNIENPQIIAFSEKALDLGSVSGNVTLDASQAIIYKMTITGATNISITNVPATVDTSLSMVLYITNGGSNISYTGSTFLFPSGIQSPLSVTGVDRVALQTLDNGTSFYVTIAGQDFKETS